LNEDLFGHPILLHSLQVTQPTYPLPLHPFYQILWIQSNAPDDGRKHRPKHVKLNLNNKLIYIVHLVGYFVVDNYNTQWETCLFAVLFTTALELTRAPSW
jgi:hypothetical protein